MASATVDSYAATRKRPASITYRGVVADAVVGTATDQDAGHAIVRCSYAGYRHILTIQ